MHIQTGYSSKNPALHFLKNKLSFLAILLVIFFPSSPSSTYAQSDCGGEVYFDLTSLTFPANLWRIEDILNVRVENTTSDSLNIYLVATVDEESSGDLFEITSGSFNLPVGFAGFLSPMDLEPIRVKDLDPEFSKFVKEVAVQTGSLPAGNYNICVRAFRNSTTVCVGEGCVVQVVEHPSPPELINPFNESFVTDDLPLFSWLPPMPSTIDVKYKIEIVEILDGQTPVEAIDANLLYYTRADLNVTSFQYPVGERAFNPGSRYAWRIEAIMGPQSPETDINPRIISQVWSFTYLGPQLTVLNEQYSIRQNSPANYEVATITPFFEWELTGSSLNTGTLVSTEDIFYNIKIWKWPDSLDAGAMGSFMADLENNTGIEPYVEVYKLTTSYFNIPPEDAGTIKNNATYFWKVFAIKNEAIISESEIFQFSILSDKDFIDAAESMLKAIDISKESRIYGLIDPLPPGSVIQSEQRSDRDSIAVESSAYLFIIDEEPYSRFGHPVQYVLVDDGTREVSAFEANWFPEIFHSPSAGDLKIAGETPVKGNDITMLTLEKPGTSPKPSREIAGNVEEALKIIDCGKYILMIDGGDKDRIGTTDNIASSASRDADLMQALYEKRQFNVFRYSQWWDNKNDSILSIPVDPASKKAVNFIKDALLDIKDKYVSWECCSSSSSSLNFELAIYINANAIPGSSKFKIYRPDGSGVCEEIDYFEDILKYLQTLPQCVKITLFIDANFSGVVADGTKLDSYLKRGNFEIKTATDAKNTTTSGVANHPTAQKNVTASAKQGTAAPRGSTRSYSEIAAALEEIDAVEATPKVNETIKKQSEDLKKAYPNPQYAKVHSRDEFTLQFPASKNQSMIRESNVIPAKSANIILNKVNGNVTVFSKIAGEIKVVVTYEDGSEETKPITSDWGDET